MNEAAEHAPMVYWKRFHLGRPYQSTRPWWPDVATINRILVNPDAGYDEMSPSSKVNRRNPPLLLRIEELLPLP